MLRLRKRGTMRRDRGRGGRSGGVPDGRASGELAMVPALPARGGRGRPLRGARHRGERGYRRQRGRGAAQAGLAVAVAAGAVVVAGALRERLRAARSHIEIAVPCESTGFYACGTIRHSLGVCGMQALVYHGPNRKQWESKPEPKLERPSDAIVQIDTATI